MFPEIERFGKWLRCRSPRATPHVHYTSDVKLFFAWAGKPPDAITLHDVVAYVAHYRGLGHAATTINRRLAPLRRQPVQFCQSELTSRNLSTTIACKPE